MVERGPEEPCVGGSTPPRPTGQVAERFRRRIVVPVYVGSSPSLPPVYLTIRSIRIVVITLACHAGDEDSISSCCSKICEPVLCDGAER